MMKDREIASGGRYDRISFTVSKGKMSEVVSENVLDLLGSHSAALYPLAEFSGLVTAEQLTAMIHDPLLVAAENTYINRYFEGQSSSTATPVSPTFKNNLLDHPLETSGFFIGSVMVGVVSALGVLKFFASKNSYSKVLDTSTTFTPSEQTDVELEKVLRFVHTEPVL
jgi:hypothetical protein